MRAKRKMGAWVIAGQNERRLSKFYKLPVYGISVKIVPDFKKKKTNFRCEIFFFSKFRRKK